MSFNNKRARTSSLLFLFSVFAIIHNNEENRAKRSVLFSFLHHILEVAVIVEIDGLVREHIVIKLGAVIVGH